MPFGTIAQRLYLVSLVGIALLSPGLLDSNGPVPLVNLKSKPHNTSKSKEHPGFKLVLKPGMTAAAADTTALIEVVVSGEVGRANPPGSNPMRGRR